MAVAMELEPFVEKDAVGAQRPWANRKVLVALAGGAAAGAVVASACNGVAGSAQDDNIDGRALRNNTTGYASEKCRKTDERTGLCYLNECADEYKWVAHPEGITTGTTWTRITAWARGPEPEEIALGTCEARNSASLMKPITSALSSALSSLTSGKEECRGWPVNGYMKDKMEGFEGGFEQVAFQVPPEFRLDDPNSDSKGLEWCRQQCLTVPGCQSISFRRWKRCAMYGVDPVRADISNSTAEYYLHHISWTDKISCFPNEATSCEFLGRIRGETIEAFSKDDKPAQSKAACRSACKEQADCKSFSYRALPFPSSDLTASCLLFTNSNLKREDVRCTGSPATVLNKCKQKDQGEYISESMSCAGRKRITEIGSHIVNAGVQLAARTAFAAPKEITCKFQGRVHEEYFLERYPDAELTEKECRQKCEDYEGCNSFSHKTEGPGGRDCYLYSKEDLERDDVGQEGRQGLFTSYPMTCEESSFSFLEDINSALEGLNSGNADDDEATPEIPEIPEAGGAGQ